MRLFPTLSALAVLLVLTGLSRPLSAQTRHYHTYHVEGLQPLDAGAIAGAELGTSPSMELIVSGLNANGEVRTQLYSGNEEIFYVDPKNVGDTTWVLAFNRVTQTLEQVWRSRIMWHDLEGDGDPDLVLLGARNLQTPFNPVTAVYLNHLGALRSPNTSPALPGIYDGAVALGDVYDDGRIFVVLSGRSADAQPTFGLYQIEVSGDEANVGLAEIATALPGLVLSALALGDCDADGDLDIALTGLDGVGRPQFNLYRNTSAGFAEVPQSVPGVFNGSLAFGDIDRDGDADLVVTGATYGPMTVENITALYRSADCTLTKDGAFNAPTLAGNTAILADHDGDGDLDLLLNGFVEHGAHPNAALYIYQNDGSGSFSGYAEHAGALYSNAAWLDLNGDGFLNPLVAGNRAGAPTIILYR